MIRGTCDKARLLDIVENFTLFSQHKAGLVKIIGQNHRVPFVTLRSAGGPTFGARVTG